MCFSLVDRKNTEMIFSSFKSPFCIFGGRERSWGTNASGGKEGKASQPGKGGKDLSEEKGEDLKGGKALEGKGGKGSQQGTGGKDLREEREKIWGQRP